VREITSRNFIDGGIGNEGNEELDIGKCCISIVVFVKSMLNVGRKFEEITSEG
jgi:hypothetical protein